MIKFEDVRHRAEALLEVGNLLERIAKLDHRRLAKHSFGVHHELTMLEAVEVTGNEEEIGTTLHRQEPRAGYIDTVGILEVLYGGTDGSL